MREDLVSKAKVDRYLRLNGKYMIEGEELLNKGDYSQAAEKFWGAAAEIVKAVPERMGRKTETHAELWDLVIELDKKHPELGLMHDFYDANHLHSNFYEDELRPEAVRLGAQSVRNLISKMQRFI